MKLVYVPGSLNPGGAETQTCRHVVRLRERGYDVTMVLPHGPGKMPGNLLPYLQENAVPIVNLIHSPNKRMAMELVFRRIKPDVVHTVGYPITLDAAIAAQNAGVPVRVMRFDNTGFTRQEFPQTPEHEARGLKAATHYVGNSHAVAASVYDYHGVEPDAEVQVIPNGVTLPPVTKPEQWQAAREYWQLKPNEVAIGLLANFRQDGLKNQVMLVRAAKRVLERCPNAVFILSGYRTAYQDEVEREIARLGLVIGERVRLPGRLDDLSLLAGWDIGVNTSLTEGFSNAIQECMAYGKPMVVTDVGGNPDQVTAETGFVVPSDDHQRLADRLIHLIEHPIIRARLGSNARAWARQHWDWDAVLDRWLALYRSGLSQAEEQKDVDAFLDRIVKESPKHAETHLKFYARLGQEAARRLKEHAS